MEKHLILDAMGVIYTVGDDTGDLLWPFIKQKNKDATFDVVADSYMKASLGTISSQTFWEQVGLGNNLPHVETEYLFEKISIDLGLHSCLTRLSSRYTVSMLSNDVASWSKILRKKFQLDDFIKHYFISGEIGIRKPDKEIYRIVLKGLGANPQDCVFVDDRVKNLLPASELGMKTLQFVRDSGEVPEVPNIVTSFQELEKSLLSLL